MNKNINPKSLKGKDIFNRTLELMNKLTPINESVINSSLEFVKRAPNGLTYTIIRENRKYFIKSTEKTEFKISELDYIGGLQNKMDESYNSYEEALKHLNMKFQQLNEMYGNKSGINSFEMDEVEMDEVDSDEQEDVKDRKYKLKIKSDSTDTETTPSSDMGEMEPSGEMETPEISDAPADSEMGEMEPSGEMEMGGEDTGEMEPSGDEETGEMEMGDEEDEMDIDIDEEEDPKKYIQKLTGRLGQKLRELSEVDPKLEKYVINSIISALHIDKMDKKDRIDIMKKFKRKKGMESVMTESYDMDEYYGMTSLDGPFNFEKLKSRVSDENQMRMKSIKRNKPMRFKKYELDMDSDEQWQVPLATAIGSGIGSYFANKDEGMDEELRGGQRKLDLNRNGRLDSEDFKMLRMKKKKSSDEGMGEFEDDRKKRLADALKRIKNKRQSSDERFGAYDDIKFRSAKDEYNGGDRDVETIDPDIEIEEPLTPPKPKYPDPFNPEIPDTYPQPKAEKKYKSNYLDQEYDIDWDEKQKRHREEELWKEKGTEHWKEQRERREELERLKKDWEKEREDEERYKNIPIPTDEMFGGGDRDVETIEPDIEIEEPLTPPKPKYPDPFNPEIPDTYPPPKAEKKYKKDLTFENIINKYRIKK